MTLAILVIAVNRLTPVAARGDVVDGVGEFDAQGAGRGVILRGEVGNWLDLTPIPVTPIPVRQRRRANWPAPRTQHRLFAATMAL